MFYIYNVCLKSFIIFAKFFVFLLVIVNFRRNFAAATTKSCSGHLLTYIKTQPAKVRVLYNLIYSLI